MFAPQPNPNGVQSGLTALDLYCGAGGATRGLQMAGFHVTAVDIKPQPRNPADRFIVADVLTLSPERASTLCTQVHPARRTRR